MRTGVFAKPQFPAQTNDGCVSELRGPIALLRWDNQLTFGESHSTPLVIIPLDEKRSKSVFGKGLLLIDNSLHACEHVVRGAIFFHVGNV